MNSIERVAAAIDMRVPDRVPVDLHNFLPAAEAFGRPFTETFRDGELLAQSMLDAWREFGHDMILLENGTGCNAEACGAEVSYRDDAAPVAEEPLISSLDEVADLVVRDPETDRLWIATSHRQALDAQGESRCWDCSPRSAPGGGR